MPLNDVLLRARLGESYALEYHQEIASTNDRALALAREGAPAGTLVVAEYQTAGRGQRGASWVAPPESSVLMSLLLRVPAPQPPAHLAIVSGLGAAAGLDFLGAPVKIKWPNDLMLADCKVAGILVETVEQAVVLGIGINCSTPTEAFPDAWGGRAQSLLALGYPVTREDVLLAVVEHWRLLFDSLLTDGVTRLLVPWNKMNWLARRKVRVSGPLGAVDGDGLFLNGRLQFDVFKDHGVIAMPLASRVEAR